MDTTRTDHHPNNPSHPTPRARDLRERLDSAADEGLPRRRLDDGAFRRFIDDVKARTDLVALIGHDLALEPSGSVLKARSPKHRDTDPSFVVFPHTQTWHDFSGGGSGGGDCLDYLVEHRGLGFMEALRTLAAETGVPMPGWSAEQAEAEAKRVVERRRIEALLTEAAGYYHRVLPSKIRRELYGEARTGVTAEGRRGRRSDRPRGDRADRSPGRARPRPLRRYVRADLLVVDDFAVLAMDPAQAKLAFQVISDRYDYRRSTCITTNRPFKDWPKVFPDALNAQVIAERLTERAEAVPARRKELPQRQALTRLAVLIGEARSRLLSPSARQPHANPRRRQGEEPPRGQRLGPWVPVIPVEVVPGVTDGDRRARSITDPSCRTGCERVAAQIQKHTGGDIKRIVPVDPHATRLGGYRGSNPGWAHHEVVVKDGRVYDAFTGHKGATISEYKSLWEHADAIDFGF